eukprot:1803793-Alexandrium_andersonii.AAC.1
MVLSGVKTLAQLCAEDKAVRWGKTLRAKAAMHLSDPKTGLQAFFEPVPDSMRHMEDGTCPKTWSAYQEA